MKKSKFFFILAAVLALFFGNAFPQTRDIPLQAYELRMNGDPHAAIALLDSALLIYPDSARMWFEKGRCQDWVKAEGCIKFTDTWKYMAPRLRASKKCFNKAIRLDPDNARYHYWAAENGALRSLLGIYSPWKWPAVPFIMGKSVDHAESAVYLSPENTHYRYTLVIFSRFGVILGGNKKSARAHADTLDAIDPVYGTMAFEELETKKKPYDAASRYFELESAYPQHLLLLQKLAQINSFKGSDYSDMAISYYKKILELDPLNTEVMPGLSRLMTRSVTDDMLPMITGYIENAANGYNYHKALGYRQLGRYYQLKGDQVKAKENFAGAERLNPNNCSTNIKDLDPPGK